MVVARDRYLAEDAAAAHPGRATSSCPSSWASRRPATASALVHADVPDNVSAHLLQEVGDARAAMAAAPNTADPRARDRAQRLHADGGQGRLRPLGRRRRVAAALLLDPDDDRRARGRRRRSWGCRSPRSSASPPTSAAASASRSCTRGPRRCSSPGRPATSAATSSGPRTAASTSSPAPTSAGQLQEVTVGFDDEGRLLALDVRVLARQRRLHPVRDHRPDHHGDPAARPLQAGRLPRRVLLAVHQHRSRDAVPGRRPAAGLLRDGAHDGRHRGPPRPRPRRGPLAATSSSPTRCPTTTA